MAFVVSSIRTSISLFFLDMVAPLSLQHLPILTEKQQKKKKISSGNKKSSQSLRSATFS
jgi:hypothetical protein